MHKKFEGTVYIQQETVKSTFEYLKDHHTGKMEKMFFVVADGGKTRMNEFDLHNKRLRLNLEYISKGLSFLLMKENAFTTAQFVYENSENGQILGVM